MVAREAHHLSCIVFEEVNCFSSVAIGLGPAFAHLVNHPGVKMKTTLAQQVSSREEIASPFLSRDTLPCLKGRRGSIYRLIGLLDSGTCKIANDLIGLRRI